MRAKAGTIESDKRKEFETVPDFNKVLTPGDIDGGVLNTVEENP